MNENKKMKAQEVDKSWDDVKSYILKCPHVPATHPAITSAIKGLELEKQRQDRDAKLRRKFSNQAVDDEPVIVSYNDDAGTNNRLNISASSGSRQPRKEIPNSKECADMEQDDVDDDWHDVNRDESKGTEIWTNNEQQASVDTESNLGQSLARETVTTLGSWNVQVRSPVAAIAVAIHSLLTSKFLRFVCTGVPDDGGRDSNASTKGFAAPIRDVPKTQFLPSKWEENSSTIVLRYRKDDSSLGTRILHVTATTSEDSATKFVITVKWNSPSPSLSTNKTTMAESLPSELVFQLEDYFNNDSWSKALAGNPAGSVPPTLHYKNLSTLLSKFCQHFDLGTFYDCSSHDNDVSADNKHITSLPYRDSSVNYLPTRIDGMVTNSTTTNTRYVPPGIGGGCSNVDNTTNGSQTRLNPGCRRGGDFDGDLFSSVDFGGAGNNGIDPLRVRNPPDNMGNLLGPNHPVFRRQHPPPHVNDPAFYGVGGLMPKFDPYGPPPTHLDIDIDGYPGLRQPKDGFRPPSKGFGPNPDHLRPPGFGSNDHMFM